MISGVTPAMPDEDVPAEDSAPTKHRMNWQSPAARPVVAYMKVQTAEYQTVSKGSKTKWLKARQEHILNNWSPLWQKLGYPNGGVREVSGSLYLISIL